MSQHLCYQPDKFNAEEDSFFCEDEALAIEFVRESYAILSQCPDDLILFYNEQSSMISLEESDRSSSQPASGLQAIKEKISTLEFFNSLITISSLDTLKCIDGSRLITVIGDFNFGSKFKRFFQTFVLARQSGGFFILNDVCRYFNYDASEVIRLDEAPCKNEVVDKANSLKESQDRFESKEEPLQEKKSSLSNSSTKLTTELSTSKQSESKPVISVPQKKEIRQPLPILKESSTPPSWASIAYQKDISSWGTHVNTAVVGSVSSSPRSSPSNSASHSSSSSSSPIGTHSSSANASPNSMSRSKNHKKQHNHLNCLYVKGLTAQHEISQLREIFSQGGKLIDIQKNEKYAIIEYDSEETAKYAVNLAYLYDGKKLSVELKKENFKKQVGEK